MFNSSSTSTERLTKHPSDEDRSPLASSSSLTESSLPPNLKPLSNPAPDLQLRPQQRSSAESHSASAAAPIAPFICISSVLRRLLLQAKIASAHTQVATVEGEPGSGKHLFAQTMHHHSSLNHLRFRRADAREWLSSEADTSVLSGTLYLDRVDLLAFTGQQLLLNLIKTLQDTPPPQFLLLVSVHSSLRHLASQGHFLPDLAFRLSAVRFSLPPLRDHREDVAPIAQALLDRICSRYRQPAAVLASGTLPRLLQHSWPGNVRELASTLECAVLESKTGIIRPNDLVLEPFRQAPIPAPFTSEFAPQQDSLASSMTPRTTASPIPEVLTLNAAINRHIQYVLDLNRGNKLRAARQLDISRSTLYRILAGQSYSADAVTSCSAAAQRQEPLPD